MPIRTTCPETYADFGDSRKPRVERDRALGAVGDVDQLGRAAAADLLAEAAGEALERALGDPLLARDLLRGRAEHDQPGSSARRLRISGAKKSRSATSWVGSVSPVASKTRPR